MKKLKKAIIRYIYILIALVFWIFIWYIAAKKIDNAIFLPAPKQVLKALMDICRKKEFIITVLKSFLRIFKGFLSALIIGIFMGTVAYFIKICEVLISPLMKLIKVVPVASFIILVLLWTDSENLATLISFMMALPIIYTNVLMALKNTDENLLEVMYVFNVGFFRKIKYIYVPEVLPALIAASKVALGFSFKSGITAEIIGLPLNSIGFELYQAKLYLMTEEMFAWTIVIILLSILIEGICICLLNKFSKKNLKINRFRYREKKHNIKKYQICDNVCKKEIKIENISKCYDKKCILKDTNLTIDSEKIMCIMGESGSGKTTLARIIMGITNPDAGRICGIDNLKKAMVFQEDRLIENATVYTNLYCILGNRFSKSTVDKHLEELGLKDIGYKMIKELSGGMKRRVAIARAILTDFDVIILDEPFKGLDERNKKITIEYVKKYCMNKIALIITHDIDEVKEFSEIPEVF